MRHFMDGKHGSRGIAMVMVCLFACIGCTTKSTTPATTAADTGPYRWESDGKTPPIDLSTMRHEVDRVDTFEEMPIDEDVVDVQAVEAVVDVPEEKTPDRSQIVGDGYRIQVFASGDPKKAEVVQRAAEARLGEPAYIEEIDGMFKVRVGNCWARQEAEELLQRCRGNGYEDAWIVVTKVTQTRREE